jgi:hypothetical protein
MELALAEEVPGLPDAIDEQGDDAIQDQRRQGAPHALQAVRARFQKAFRFMVKSRG